VMRYSRCKKIFGKKRKKAWFCKEVCILYTNRSYTNWCNRTIFKLL